MKELKKSNWQPQGERFVAVLDILGFKELVMREDHETTYERLLKLSDHIKRLESPKVEGMEERFWDTDIKTYNFSDSIMVFSKTDSHEDFHVFVHAIEYLMSSAVRMEVPIKGAIAHGNITLNQSQNIYFGQALIDAYLLEEELKYLGVAVHNSINRYVRDNNSVELSSFFREHFIEIKTPLRTGLIKHYNLNWFRKALKDAELFHAGSEEDKTRYLNDLIDKFRVTTSGQPRVYYDNTQLVLEAADQHTVKIINYI